eukprot:4271638-Prymnesium_polylepis.1
MALRGAIPLHVMGRREGQRRAASQRELTDRIGLYRLAPDVVVARMSDGPVRGVDDVILVGMDVAPANAACDDGGAHCRDAVDLVHAFDVAREGDIARVRVTVSAALKCVTKRRARAIVERRFRARAAQLEPAR